MTGGRKQKAAKDLWALAGGFSVVVKEFSKQNVGHTIPYNSEIWTNLSLSIFGNDIKQYKHWLWVIWHDNRRGLKDQVLLSRKLKSQPPDPVLRCSDTEEKLHGDTNMTKERPTESGTLCTSQDSTHSNSQIQVSEDDVDDTSWESADYIEKPLLQEIDNDKTNIKNAAQSCAVVQETVGTAVNESEILEELVSEESGIHTTTMELSEMVTDFAKERTDSEHVSVTVKDSFDSLVTATENAENDSQPQRNTKKIRKVYSVPKTFKISLSKKKWRAIKPKIGSVQLRKPWTHIIYEAFSKVNPNCVLAFKYQHVRLMHSRKRSSAFVNIRAVCTFPTCNAQYIFLMKRKPSNMQRKVFMTVYRRGQICHLKEHTRKRQASNVRRGKIAKVIHKGVSQVYYRKLRRTPVEEIMAGNVTRSLNRDILKVISSEVKKAASLHDNVLLEMHLTQKIMKECDTSYRHLPGYIQNYQVDPFSCHMYTEKGISILVTHMRKKSPVTLYLDATGSVVSKIPEQKKRVLYYALVLAGQGHCTPPLPIAEMLSNDHTVPSVSFWLMQFVHNLSKFTTLKIRYLETDYSWALIQAVLLAFNKESILSYLDRCFDVCQGKNDGMDSKSFTVIHLCSAHVLKAVAQAICRHVTDKGHREFVIFVFARLQNSQTLDEAIRIFQALCIVLNTRTNTASVQDSIKTLQELIQFFILDIPMPENRVQVNTRDDKDEQSRTIVGRSRFSTVFRRAFDEATKVDTEEEESSEENLYYCPSIIRTLFNTYMAIFPMWSGVMLGDLKRHAADKDITSMEDGGQRQDNKTRETNCHVEGWFAIVKQHILMKSRRLWPGNFVRKMYSSLRGRYIEHIMQHGFPLKLLQKPLNLKDIKFAEESWAKKEKLTASKMGESKFYSVPTSVPHPKRKSRKAKRHVTTTVDQASEEIFKVSNNQMQDISTISVPQKTAKQQTTTTNLGEASAPKKKQQRKPKKHDHSAHESETQSRTFSFEKVDLSSLTTIRPTGLKTHTHKNKDVANTLETTPLNVHDEVCKIHNVIK